MLSLVFLVGADGPNRARFVVPPAPERAPLLESYQVAIRDLDFDYGQVGSVLEAIGYLELLERFPAPRFAVAANTQYLNEAGRTLGEIDLAVVDTVTGRVHVIYEAKLTGNPRSAEKVATRQIERLRTRLKDGSPIFFRGRPGDPKLSAAAFLPGTPMFRMGSRESEAHGWEAVLDISRPEGGQLQAKLIRNEQITGKLLKSSRVHPTAKIPSMRPLLL